MDYKPIILTFLKDFFIFSFIFVSVGVAIAAGISEVKKLHIRLYLRPAIIAGVVIGFLHSAWYVKDGFESQQRLQEINQMSKKGVSLMVEIMRLQKSVPISQDQKQKFSEFLDQYKRGSNSDLDDLKNELATRWRTYDELAAKDSESSFVTAKVVESAERKKLEDELIERDSKSIKIIKYYRTIIRYSAERGKSRTDATEYSSQIFFTSSLNRWVEIEKLFTPKN